MYTDNNSTITFTKELRTVWDPSCTDICSELEKGGYKAEIAGDDFPRLVNASRALLERRIRGLVIFGAPGAGKTLAASILAKGVLSIPTYGGDCRPLPPKRIDCSNINYMDPEELRAFATLAGGAQNWWIEDIGVESPVNEYGTKLDPVASFFYNLPPMEKSPDWCPVFVLATTNLTPGQLAERYGARTSSRMADHFGWLQLEHGDERRGNAIKF